MAKTSKCIRQNFQSVKQWKKAGQSSPHINSAWVVCDVQVYNEWTVSKIRISITKFMICHWRYSPLFFINSYPKCFLTQRKSWSYNLESAVSIGGQGKYISLPWFLVVAALSIYRRTTLKYKQPNQHCNSALKERARFLFSNGQL